MHGPPPATDDPPATAEERLEAAYRACGTAVLGYALRRAATREDAYDVVAETFATAWRRRADLPADAEEVRPWLFGVARLCLANAARSSRRAGRLGERLAGALADADVPDPAALHEDGVLRRSVRAALDRLSPEDRELVTLVAWEGLSPTQAAAALGIAPGTARVRLHRTRARLRVLLDPTDPEEAGDAR
ncbi:RNA polymerase sigma factor [Geodermatophilus nigrescens]